MVDAGGGGDFVFWFSRTQENAFLEAFSKNFVPHMFFCSAEKWRSHGPPTPPPRGCTGPVSHEYMKQTQQLPVCPYHIKRRLVPPVLPNQEGGETGRRRRL